MRKNRIIIYSISIFLVVIIITTVIFTNITCIKKISTEKDYSKNNGYSLINALTSTFNTWGDDIDTSSGYKISKECIDEFGYSDTYASNESYDKMREASLNNVIIGSDLPKATSKKTIYVNQCIILRDIKVLYLTFNTFFSDKNKLILLSLYDDIGNIIAKEPSLVDMKSGLMMRNVENYFWGIEFEKYEKLILHIKVYSKKGKFIYEYDQPIY